MKGIEVAGMKKGLVTRIAVLALSGMLLSGCGLVDTVYDSVHQVLVDKQAEIYGRQFTTLTEESMSAAGEAVTEMDYAYAHLDGEDQTVYLELLTILTSYEEDVRIMSMNPDQVDLAYQAILMDHPELFYINGYTITEHTIDGQTEFYTFSGRYTYTREERDEKQQQVDAAAAQILSGIPEGASAYEKEKYIYDYIVLHTDYNEDAPDNQNILSVLLNGESVCQGYAFATQYLLEQVGIPCTTVTGDAKNPEGVLVSHAWNFVQLDGEYYYVDTTWGDPVTGMDSEALHRMGDVYVNYDYLNLTTAQISVDHTADAPVELPDCTAVTWNYYRAEGLYYETYDRSLLAERLTAAAADGKTYLMMKFPDSQVYEQYISRLFDGQEIFGLLPSLKSISYTADPESYLLIVYLD